MDITKYIGLFLLKNRSCYIQGLGNLEIKSRNALYDDKALHAQSYEVILNPVGAIDDSLANFIATNELISISKAVNALRDFTMQCKADLQAGKEVQIPSIGKFHESEGRIWFSTDPKLQFTPAPIPAARMTRHVEEQPEYKPKQQQRQQQYRQQQQYSPPPPPPPEPYYRDNAEEEEESTSINWGRVIFAISLLFVLGIGAMYLYQIYKERKGNNIPLIQQTPAAPVQTDTTLNQPSQVTMPVDTTKTATDSTKHDSTTINGPDILENGASPTPVVKPPVSKAVSYEVVINKYFTAERAQKRLQQLKAYGYSVKMVAEDSTNYLIIMNVKFEPKEQEKVIDSLSALFNPDDGVYIR